MQPLFQDWTGIVRMLKKVPSLVEYEQLSRYSIRPLLRIAVIARHRRHRKIKTFKHGSTETGRTAKESGNRATAYRLIPGVESCEWFISGERA
jgi:hypothetical protein